jgi:hypothetical protein
VVVVGPTLLDEVVRVVRVVSELVGELVALPSSEYVEVVAEVVVFWASIPTTAKALSARRIFDIILDDSKGFWMISQRTSRLTTKAGTERKAAIGKERETGSREAKVWDWNGEGQPIK